MESILYYITCAREGRPGGHIYQWKVRSQVQFTMVANRSRRPTETYHSGRANSVLNGRYNYSKKRPCKPGQFGHREKANRLLQGGQKSSLNIDWPAFSPGNMVIPMQFSWYQHIVGSPACFQMGVGLDGVQGRRWIWGMHFWGQFGVWEGIIL